MPYRTEGYLYRDPAKATKKNEFPHASAEVPYEFRDGKLRAGKVKFIEAAE